MAKWSTKLEKEILHHFKKTQTIFFSTCQGKKPRVRPLYLIYFDKNFWICTGSKDAKIKQIDKNNNFEFCLLLQTKKYSGYIRGSGKVKVVKVQKTRKRLADNIQFFKTYFKDAADPGYALLRLNIKDIEYVKPGKMVAQKVKI